MPPHGCFLNDDCVTTFSIVFSHSIRKRPILHTAPQAPKARRLLGVGSLCFTSQRKPRIIFLSSYSLHQPSSKVSTTLNAELLSNREKFSRKYHVFFEQVRLWSWLQKPLQTKEKTSKKVSSFFYFLAMQQQPKIPWNCLFPTFFATLCDMRRTQQWDAGTQPILCQKAWEEKIAPLLIDAKSCLSLSGTVCNVMETSRIMRVLYHP